MMYVNQLAQSLFKRNIALFTSYIPFFPTISPIFVVIMCVCNASLLLLLLLSHFSRV